MRKLAIAQILLCITVVVVEASGWTGTWACSIYSDSQLNTDFSNSTVRQVLRVAIPGNQVQLTFSNLFAASPRVMQKAHLAQSAGGHSINSGTDVAVTFSGSESVTIPAGGVPTRTTVDGVGVAKVIPDYDGDLDRDGKVDRLNMSILSEGRQTVYEMPTLIDIAER